MKSDVPHDTFGLDVVARVLSVSGETVDEDGIYPFGIENNLNAHQPLLFWVPGVCKELRLKIACLTVGVNNNKHHSRCLLSLNF